MFQFFVSHLNWLHVLVATVAYFVLGAIWYGPLFSKAWIRGHNIDVSNPDAKKGVAKIMALSFVAFFVITFAVAIIMYIASVHNIIDAVQWGAFLGCFIAAPVIVINYLYQQKPLSVHLIDALYHIIGLIIVCVILVMWR
jgi:hypothetical protein